MSSIAGFDRSRDFGSDRPRSMENIHTIVAEFYGVLLKCYSLFPHHPA